MTLWSLKYMGRLIIKLKAIKLEKDFFYYLSSYLDLDLQAACFLILISGCMPLSPFFWAVYLKDFQQNIFAQALDPRSVLIIWNLSYTLSLLLTRYQRPIWRQQAKFSLAIISNCNWADLTPGSHTRYIQQVVLLLPAWWFQKPKALCEAIDLVGIDL